MTEEQFKKTLQGPDFEGSVNHFYRDTKGKVTIGIGLMFENEDAVAHSGITFYNKKGAKASDNEIREDFKRIKKATSGMAAHRYRRDVQLTADGNSLNVYFEKRFREAVKDAKIFFHDERATPGPNRPYSNFDELPDNIRFALIDMAFNLGRTKLMKYQKLKNKLKEGDWDAAAKESFRHGIPLKRNSEIYKWIASESLPKEAPTMAPTVLP